MTAAAALGSWADKPARHILEYLERVCDTESPDFVQPEERIAVFDNDGTLWCERPGYVQAAFVIDELRERVAESATLAEQPVVQSLLAGDLASALEQGGLGAVAEVLLDSHAGLAAEAFTARVQGWLSTASHPRFGARYTDLVYQPMLELLDLLRAHDFRLFIVTGGGVEFTRALSEEAYGIRRDDVIGSAVELTFQRDDTGVHIVRTATLLGSPNEGEPKPINIQMHIGRRPILAAGNTAGDREMLEYTAGNPHASLCLVIDHDDDVREYAYAGTSATNPNAEPILDTATRHGWTVVSMRDDWTTIFPDTLNG